MPGACRDGHPSKKENRTSTVGIPYSVNRLAMSPMMFDVVFSPKMDPLGFPLTLGIPYKGQTQKRF